MNDEVLQKLAAQQQGSCCLMLPTDEVAGAVERLGARLRRSVVTALSVEGDWEFPGAVSPSVYSEDRLSLSLRAASGNPGDIQISGTGPDGSPVSLFIRRLHGGRPRCKHCEQLDK